MPPLLFASCLPAGCRVAPVVALPPPLVLSSHLHLATSRFASTSCLPAGCLVSPVAVPQPPPPLLYDLTSTSCSPAGCRITQLSHRHRLLSSHCTALPRNFSCLCLATHHLCLAVHHCLLSAGVSSPVCLFVHRSSRRCITCPPLTPAFFIHTG